MNGFIQWVLVASTALNSLTALSMPEADSEGRISLAEWLIHSYEQQNPTSFDWYKSLRYGTFAGSEYLLYIRNRKAVEFDPSQSPNASFGEGSICNLRLWNNEPAETVVFGTEDSPWPYRNVVTREYTGHIGSFVSTSEVQIELAGSMSKLADYNQAKIICTGNFADFIDSDDLYGLLRFIENQTDQSLAFEPIRPL